LCSRGRGAHRGERAPASCGGAQAPKGQAARGPAAGLDQTEVRAILRAYWKGDISTASSRARGSLSRSARRRLAPLARFASAWRAGLADQDPAAAIRWLESAADADRVIDPGRKGRLSRALGKALAARHLALAETLPGNDDLPRAAAHLIAAAQA